MDDRDLRDIKLYGVLAAVSGAFLIMVTLVALGVVLVTGGTNNSDSFVTGALDLGAMIILGAALSGIGGDLQRANRLTALGRENLRLDWTALFIVLIVEFAFGLWMFQPIALISSLYIIGLIWIRSPVVRVTSR